MTYRVGRSKIAAFPDFGAEVARYVGDLNAWHEHAEKAKTDPEYHPYPRPVAHPEVVAAVSERAGDAGVPVFVPDFIVEDDGPTPEQKLRAKKNILLAHVSDLEREAAHAVLPIGKRRIHFMREAEVRFNDSKRRSDLINVEHQRRQSAGFLERMRERIAGKKSDEPSIADIVEKARDPKADEFLARADAINAKLRAIELHGAELHAEIEDLTEENVDDWKPAPFPGATTES